MNHTNLINYVIKIQNYKISFPSNNYYRKLRVFKKKNDDNIWDYIKSNAIVYEELRSDYLPNSIDILYKRDLIYNADDDNSIYSLLDWSSQLVLFFKKDINIFINYKTRYEKALFSGDFVTALKYLDIIETEICYSLWGIYQKLLVWTLLGLKNEKTEFIYKLHSNAKSNNYAAFLTLYYEKLTDKSVGIDEYASTIHRLFEGSDNGIVAKYCDYKLNIVAPKTIQGIKTALIFDEQLSIIDYYETYIDALQLLSNRKSIFDSIYSCINNAYPHISDLRIRNLYISFVKPNINTPINKTLCSMIENYTCGNYQEIFKIFSNQKNKFLSDFTTCNLWIKTGIDLSKEDIPFQELWTEIYNVYTFNYDIENSIQIIGGYFKLLYRTSWKYKLLGILVRKLNFITVDDIVALSTLNDRYLTPLFYQTIPHLVYKNQYLDLFENEIPITVDLHRYILSGSIDSNNAKMIHPIRWCYYEIKRLFNQGDYDICIKKCNIFLSHEIFSKANLYYQERIRRILYHCYLEDKQYIVAMNLYMESYVLSKELVTHMQLDKLILKLEQISNNSTELGSNIYRPIILLLYYKNVNDELVSAYLDYLESKNCRTIKQLLETFVELDSYEIIFLSKVCSQSLLMRDYVSKTEMCGSAAELRVAVLRVLLKFDVSSQKEYLSELNSIYKSSQLQKKIDSFNHNRIFIDKENLFKYLKDDLHQEFSKFKSAQEIKSIFYDLKEYTETIFFIIEQYLDTKKFFFRIVEKIKIAYLNESPYSLEDFLSTRIRHNYCNDNLKKAFENEKLFSKKIKDSSKEYIINEYWKDKLSSEDYTIVIEVLSKFSQTIDNKIQEIKEKWIRIKKNNDGLFDYNIFTERFLDMYHYAHVDVLENVEEYFYIVISELDKYTANLLGSIREKIDAELKPYYNTAICELETDIRKLKFNSDLKNEMLRRIEITKAKYLEDIEGFKDIFNMDNEKYPDFSMDELIEFCQKIEEDMNNQFLKSNLTTDLQCDKIYHGRIFPYLVDILSILIRNSVQHSQMPKMEDLTIDISIVPYVGSKVEQEILSSTEYREFEYNTPKNSLVFNVKNNLSPDVDINELSKKAGEKIQNIYAGKYRHETNNEGGSGLYKIARTIYYNLNSTATFFQLDNDGYFDISIAIDLTHFEVK